MKAAKILKEKIAGTEVVTGAIVSFHLWPELVEIAINAGLDYLLIDLEHGCYSEGLVADVCARGRLLDFPILIRPHSHSFDTVRKVMDMGPCGLMIAMVNSAAVLDEVRDAIYLPPRGKRRPGGPGNRWIRDFNYETWRSEVEDHIIVLPQIESRAGLENVDAIAQHEITTAMAAGPYDLAADLGVCWKPDDALLIDSMDKVRQAATKAGKNFWAIGDGPMMKERGFNFLCISEPMMQLEAALKSAVGAVKDSSSSGEQLPLP